jgi:hypothetical protein
MKNKTCVLPVRGFRRRRKRLAPGAAQGCAWVLVPSSWYALIVLPTRFKEPYLIAPTEVDASLPLFGMTREVG